MNIRRLGSLCLGLTILSFSGCDSGEVWRSGAYSVAWIDISADLELVLNLGNGSSIGRVMPQVFAVGEDAKWIVVGRYPDGDKSKEEFYYFAKADDGPYKETGEVVKGPFSSAQFEKLRQELGLPNWTKKFK